MTASDRSGTHPSPERYELHAATSRLANQRSCRELLKAAERELSAFYLTVYNLSGEFAAYEAAENWLQILASSNLDCENPARSLRAVTIFAAANPSRARLRPTNLQEESR
jgi:hypothetical protein